MFKSTFCTHWKQKHRPHSEDSAPSNHRWGGLFTFSEVGRPVPDRKQWIDKQLPLYWWACLDRRRNITVRTTTGGFQQNFGVFTNFNNVFYDLLLSYFMPGFEQICRVANYCEKIQLSTTVLQYLQPDLSLSLTLALPLACWTSPTSTSWVSNVFKSDRSSRSCYDPDYGTEVKVGLFYLGFYFHLCCWFRQD